MILGPKRLIGSFLDIARNFHKKMGSVTFVCLLNPNFMFRKVMSQSLENGVTNRTEFIGPFVFVNRIFFKYICQFVKMLKP